MCRCLSAALAVVVTLGLSDPDLARACEHPHKDTIKSTGDYVDELLKTALARTEGPDAAEIRAGDPIPVTRNRLLIELIEGRHIEYATVPAKPEWEKNLITVRIPLRKGLQGYRLFFVTEENKDLLTDVSSLADLKKITTGAAEQWLTTDLLETAGFTVVKGSDKDGLFEMLRVNRFETFGRGIDEIFVEHAQRKSSIPNLAIDQHIAVYLPYPTYVFVTPKRPDLAKRFETGLRMMIDDGSFDEIFWRYFEDDIARANLAGRKIFKVDRHADGLGIPLDDPRLWLDPNDLKNPGCRTNKVLD
ncbi:hypothetical protein GCM10011316_25210 [Roseibium aquae]|uniref:Amino acid ABC transporter substrate-binding protein (PAAT family) n=1 Tax=Roseibium aquae TaxID=1323746 RepID=A0A916TKB3_9HYPH|nr:transporter substrate-binding domain-containing protein [Roseibium aquae]GGB52162.1 hypothetical protein GCM10011316_25210 [Roseibium aquae]